MCYMLLSLSRKHSEWWFFLVSNICCSKNSVLFQLVVRNIFWNQSLNGVSWNQLNQKTLKLDTSWVCWKNQCRAIIGKHALIWNKHQYQHFADTFVKNIFNLFHCTGLFLFTLNWNISENQSFCWCFQRA